MVWVRLLAIIIVLGLAGLGYQSWRDSREEAVRQEREHLAQVTARVWVGAAEHRLDPAAYIAWRDSLLGAEGMSAESLQVFLQRYQDEPEGYEEYTRLVSLYVDSIIQERGELPDSVLFDTTGRDLLLE